MSQPLAVDSRAARLQFTQCQYCKDSKDQKIKLSVCGGCRVATYCSSKCQRADWPQHKQMCKIRQAANKQIAALDAQVLSKPEGASVAAGSSAADAPLVPSEVLAELRSFIQKFRPVLFQAGFNCLQIAKYPILWQQMVAWVDLERIPNPAPDSRPWSRFKITFAGPVPTALLLQKHGAAAKDLPAQKAAQERADIAAGNLGTITMMLSVKCPGPTPALVLHNMMFFAFGRHSEGALDISPRWMESLIDTVDRMCGRTAGADGADESDLQVVPGASSTALRNT